MIWTKTMNTLFYDKGQTQCQWLFLVPVKGGRWHIIPQLAVYTTYILPSGGPICYLPSFTGTRNNHWQWRSPARSVRASISILNCLKFPATPYSSFMANVMWAEPACWWKFSSVSRTLQYIFVYKEFLCICVLTYSCLFYQFPTSICMIPLPQSFQPWMA